MLNTEIICVWLSENDLKLQLLIIGTDGTGNDVSPENAISNEMKNVRNDAPTIFFLRVQLYVCLTSIDLMTVIIT